VVYLTGMSIAVLLGIESCFVTEQVSTRGLEIFETDVENHPWERSGHKQQASQ
jgi:hypothetical protein